MKLNKRSFLKTTGVVGASGLLSPSLVRADNLRGQKLRIAVIGPGGQGKNHVKALKGEQLVAFCDVDEEKAAEVYNEFPDVARFRDFRVMFDKMGSRIDAVSIAVPDHMHYPIVLWAMAHGKHVLCEKPLTRTFEEAMRLKAAAKRAGVITQMGNQGHANDGLRDVEEWIRAGLIGEVTEAFHWTNRPVWPQGMKSWPDAEAVPSSMDWDLWLGVAPKRDYSKAIAPFKWRGYRDFGCGAIGDMACHLMDASYTPLRLGYPTRVSCEAEGGTDIAFPTASTIRFDFAARDGRGPVKVTWMDGDRRPKNVPFVPDEFISGNPEQNRKGQTNGSLLVGSKGAIFVDLYATRAQIFPFDYYNRLRGDGALPPKSLPRIRGGHFAEWVEAIRSGTQPGGNVVDYAADFTGMALLGVVSMAAGGMPLEFDEQQLRFTNSARANELLSSTYAYRSGFIES